MVKLLILASHKLIFSIEPELKTKPSSIADYRIFILLISIILTSYPLFGQKKPMAQVSGYISNQRGEPLELVNIAIEGLPGGTSTDKNGFFQLQVPAEIEVNLVVSFIGFKTERIPLHLHKGEKITIRRTLEIQNTLLSPVSIEDHQIRTTSLTRIDPKVATTIPTLGGGIEALIKTMPGVTSSNELSSQYSVRGGNYDENLVYVNDVEIYRPFLVRSGQQEGLSFLNPDLVSSILFSAGGFEAKYGDKMSSVLDIQYKKPTQFGGSVSLSLLGGSFQIEGASKNKKLNYLLGVRQKTNQYILSSQQTKGDYKPSFTDVQANLNYNLHPRLEISALGNFSINLFRLMPHDRETSFGTIQEAYRLRVFFEGQEDDKFLNGMGAITATWKPNNPLRLKFIASAFRTVETETYDILAEYWIGDLETDQTNGGTGKVVEERGVGSYLNHARNRLEATVASLEHKGTFLLPDNNYINWGVKYQHESINDKLNEWTLIDSAGFALPLTTDSVGYTNPQIQPPLQIPMNEYLYSKNTLNSNRLSAYIQRSWNFTADSTKFSLTAGLRSQYWDFNRQWIFSPRATLSITPNWEKDIIFRISTGYFYQPPFYRELRDFQGNIHTDVKAQKSIQVVAAADLNFKAWSRNFKFVAEAYYKYLDHLIPYDVDNVRIRYHAKNNAHGYAVGIDLKVNGEFVKGIESWASLSLMKTMEDIEDDYYWEFYNQAGEKIIPGFTTDTKAVDSIKIEPGYLPRPSDQRISFNIFFQDYLPNNPTYKMHLNLVFGTGLPFGAPKSPRYQHIYRTPSYRRVDIGFSKLLKSEASDAPGFLQHFKSIWITAEVFNLLQFNNTVSYSWISDVNGRRYAIPNYLTPRLINLRLIFNF